MKESDVVIVSLPQADGTSKNRPAIILREMPPFQDMLVCGVNTQLHQEVKDFDEAIETADSDFKASGLVAKSLIRLGFLTVIPQSQIAGSIGSVSLERHQRLLQKLCNYLNRR